MKQLSARQILNRTITEKELLEQVKELASLLGWSFYHTYDSRRSNAGFPDLVLARGCRVIFAELKAPKGRLTPEQSAWARVLSSASAGGGIEYYMWRPSELESGQIRRALE